jgi:uncharacterized protein YhbP (UPF0306 family)
MIDIDKMNIMEKVDKIIIEFLKKHHVLTLATSVNNEPWCANCFYSFIKDDMVLVFTSDSKTKHIQDISQNATVAGSIVLETSVVGKIQGIQFTAIVTESTKDLTSKAHISYLKRFPFAVLANTSLWSVTLQSVKMTDNRLGFGKKLYWKRDE